MKIILASASPRRYEILKEHGVDAVVIPSQADEILPDEVATRGARAVCTYLAEQKARAVYERLDEQGVGAVHEQSDRQGVGAVHEQSDGQETGTVHARWGGHGIGAEDLPRLILAADTIVYHGSILGKPKDADAAFEMLAALRNRAHEVWSGVSIIDRPTGKTKTFADVTCVRFGEYPDEEIRRFVREEQPFDKSGSYAIQSSWSKNVEAIDGDIENVIGLPWRRIAQSLAGFAPAR
ncbi:MAG: Maf family protein [Clostridiales Family XIII bacterium]|nr:Maf family protein [Clostridiales Family XIII bacterium]